MQVVKPEVRSTAFRLSISAPQAPGRLFRKGHLASQDVSAVLHTGQLESYRQGLDGAAERGEGSNWPGLPGGCASAAVELPGCGVVRSLLTGWRFSWTNSYGHVS